MSGETHKSLICIIFNIPLKIPVRIKKKKKLNSQVIQAAFEASCITLFLFTLEV